MKNEREVPMHSLTDAALESNKYMKINFNGGDLSFDAGLLQVGICGIQYTCVGL